MSEYIDYALNDLDILIRKLHKEKMEKDKEVERLTKRLEESQLAYLQVDKERKRLNNIIKKLEEFIEREIELYTIELTEKNTNALSYSLPIKAVYKEIYNVLQELKGSDKE